MEQGKKFIHHSPSSGSPLFRRLRLLFLIILSLLLLHLPLNSSTAAEATLRTPCFLSAFLRCPPRNFRSAMITCAARRMSRREEELCPVSPAPLVPASLRTRPAMTWQVEAVRAPGNQDGRHQHGRPISAISCLVLLSRASAVRIFLTSHLLLDLMWFFTLLITCAVQILCCGEGVEMS